MVGTNQWANRQMRDIYVRKAAEMGYKCRSAFKLIQIDEKYNLFDKSKTKVAIDLGSAPGSWVQVIRERVNQDCLVIGVDVVDQPGGLPGAHFIHGDFTSLQVQRELKMMLEAGDNTGAVDVITSDMCPNVRGDSSDYARIAALDAKALAFAMTQLKVGGHFVCKIRGGKHYCDEVTDICTRHFMDWHSFKPEASRNDSSESFIVAVSRLAHPKRVERDKVVYGLDDWPGLRRAEEYSARRRGGSGGFNARGRDRR